MIGDITALYEAAIIAALPGSLRLARELSDTLEEDGNAWVPGGTRFQIRATYTAAVITNDSNKRLDSWSVEIAVHHHLADAGNERAWTDGGMATLQQVLAQPEFWEVLGTYGQPLQKEIDFTTPPTREGNVVSFAIEGLVKAAQPAP